MPATSAQTVGSIGYVEYAYAMQNHLPWMRMKNHDGNVVTPNMASFQASAAHADWDHADHFYMILTDQPGAEFWPIENPTFVLFYKDPPDPAASKTALDFFKWAYANGGPMAESLLYIPLPKVVTDKIETAGSRSKAPACKSTTFPLSPSAENQSKAQGRPTGRPCFFCNSAPRASVLNSP